MVDFELLGHLLEIDHFALKNTEKACDKVSLSLVEGTMPETDFIACFFSILERKMVNLKQMAK
jgi:hypothetical protein